MSEWRDCLYYPNYAVSDEGEVVRKNDGVILKQYLQKSGYVYVWVERGEGRHTIPVHRLVCIAFHGDEGYCKGLFVDHINTIRNDNRAVNLRWVTPKENANNEITKKNRKRNRMKKFNELSLNISEDEYRNNGRFHYSDIAGYLRDGFTYLIKPEKEESTSLTFGSMVDCIITEGMDVFNEKYCVSKEFNLSDNQKLVLNNLANCGIERLEDHDPDTVIDVLSNYYKNPKSQLAKLMQDGSEYYRFVYDNQDKTPVDFKMFQDAIDVANKLLTSENTKDLLAGKQSNVDRFFQLKFNGEYEGIPITAMVDLIYIDHEAKKVYPMDLKTTCAAYEWEFPKSFVKWRYDQQARLYSYILRQVMDQDDFYKDYSLEGFTFIYISRDNKHPLLWTFENNLERGDIVIETKNGRKITLEDFPKPLKEMYDIATEQREIPLNVYETYGNDVIEHLKELKL